MKKVSVIVPVFNGSCHIANAFKFLSLQKYENFETIFVVDDATTDNTREEIEKHLHMLNDARIIMQEDDDMLGGARNLGIKDAKGEIIWFLDVDDCPLPDFLSDLVSIMEEHDADIVMCNFIRSYSLDLGPDFPPKRRYGVKVMDRDTALKARLNEKIPVTAWSRITKKKLIDDNDIRFIRGYAEDIEFSYHSMSCADVICYYEKPLYLYYQNRGSICNGGAGDNARGDAEIDAYNRLDGFFKDDAKFDAKFRKGSAQTRMRSAVHMEKEHFIEYSKSKECREMIANDIGPWSMEAAVFRVAPSLYYSLVRLFLDKIYYRDGKCFTRI